MRYSTDFPTIENPLSEGGNWINGGTTGLDWSDLKVTSLGGTNTAQTTQSGSVHFNDGIAIVTGSWGPNQSVEGIIKGPTTGGANQEFELLLRFSISAHDAHGYECLFDFIANSVAVVRWNGAFNNFTSLASATPSPAIAYGDVVKATITGTTITLYINGKQQLQTTDSTYSSGSPGMGVNWTNDGGGSSDFGFTHWAAKDGVDTVLNCTHNKNQNTGAGSTVAVTINANAGDLIVVGCIHATSSVIVSGVSDNASGGTNTYVKATNSTGTHTTSTLFSEIWYCLQAARGGVTTVTVTFSVSDANYKAANVWVISGFTNPLFDSANNVTNGTGSGTTLNGPSFTALYDDEVIVGVCVPNNSVTQNPKFGDEFKFGGDIQTSGPAGASANPILSGSHQPVWLDSASADAFAASVAGFAETPIPGSPALAGAIATDYGWYNDGSAF